MSSGKAAGLVNLGPGGPRGMGMLGEGPPRFAVQFAALDPLSLSIHPAVVEAAHAAILSRGVHALGLATEMGGSDLLDGLEARLAGFLGMAAAVVFPTVSEARLAAMLALGGTAGRILLDAGVSDGLWRAATATGRPVQRFAHLSLKDLERKLARAKAASPSAGVLVVTEALFPQVGASPDLAALQQVCRAAGATLMVDLSQDLGFAGPGGRGIPGAQGLQGRLDVVIGGLEGCFAAHGGFVASSRPEFRAALRFGAVDPALQGAMAPMQAAVASAAVRIVASDEGDALRARLARNLQDLWRGLGALGYPVRPLPLGQLQVALGDLPQARRMTQGLSDRGIFVLLHQQPDGRKMRGVWTLRVQAAHAPSDLEALVTAAADLRGLSQP